MSIEIKVPAMGESVTEATVARWFKKEGDARQARRTAAGTGNRQGDGGSARARRRRHRIHLGQGRRHGAGRRASWAPSPKARRGNATPAHRPQSRCRAPKPAAPKPAPAAPQPRHRSRAAARGARHAVGAAHRRRKRRSIRPRVAGTGKDGRVTKGDMLAALEARAANAPRARAAAASAGPRANAAREERVTMSRLRKTIALRLKESQNTAAQLTTFNEVDMSHVMALRSEYKDSFEKKHGVRLGFMGFFVKACIAALKELPNVNAEIEGDDIVYKNYYDIGVAVSTERGLVVPVVRDADKLSLAGIEEAIADFGTARPRQQAEARRTAGRHLHHHQWRGVRLADVDADPQLAAVGHPRHAQDPAAPGRR